jgi:ABC-2 type transport system ATP-binding protein
MEAMSAVIRASQLTKKFKNFTAVNNISFTVQQGGIFAFLGPNGAGKSTTIKMLTTLLRPTSGEIDIAGHNVLTEQDAARSSFGIVFQDPSLDDELTAYENMELHAVLYHLPRKDMKQRITELLTLVELESRRDSQVKTFSGGMKRRLEIARGLLHHPQVLFLDEPTIGLDTQTRNLLWDYVKKLNKSENMTIFLTTHYLEEAEMVADRIAIIDHGTIIASGTTAELLKQTKTKNLEAAYLSLTGKTLRDEEVSAREAFRMRARTRRMR